VSIRVVRLALASVAALVLLTSADRAGVDAETGDLLELATTLLMPGLGSVSSRTRLEDYRVVNGVRPRFRQVESNEQVGRTVYEVERVEFDVDVDDELFMLRPGEPAVAAATVRP
jgi:hypothetical protein